MLTTTLNKIRNGSPCFKGWTKLLKSLDKTEADDELLPFSYIVRSNGIDDALWAIKTAPEYMTHWQALALEGAALVQGFIENETLKEAMKLALAGDLVGAVVLARKAQESVPLRNCKRDFVEKMKIVRAEQAAIYAITGCQTLYTVKDTFDCVMSVYRCCASPVEGRKALTDLFMQCVGESEMKWTPRQKGARIEMLGLVPHFVFESDPRPARKQFHERYAHSGGWSPYGQGKWKMLEGDVLKWPGDSPFKPLFETRLRDERILFYRYALVAIVQPDGSFEVSRMD